MRQSHIASVGQISRIDPDISPRRTMSSSRCVRRRWPMAMMRRVATLSYSRSKWSKSSCEVAQKVHRPPRSRSPTFWLSAPPLLRLRFFFALQRQTFMKIQNSLHSLCRALGCGESRRRWAFHHRWFGLTRSCRSAGFRHSMANDFRCEAPNAAIVNSPQTERESVLF